MEKLDIAAKHIGDKFYAGEMNQIVNGINDLVDESSSLNTKTANLSVSATSVNADVVKLKKSTEDLSAKTASIESTVSPLVTDVDNLKSTTSTLTISNYDLYSKFDKLDGKVTSASTKLDSLSTNIGGLNTKVNSNEAGVNQLNTKYNDLNSWVTTLAATSNDYKKQIGDLQTSATTLNNKSDNLKDIQDAIKKKTDLITINDKDGFNVDVELSPYFSAKIKAIDGVVTIISQATGNAITEVMSQKAVTDELNKLQDEIDDIVDSADTLSNDIRINKNEIQSISGEITAIDSFTKDLENDIISNSNRTSKNYAYITKLQSVAPSGIENNAFALTDAVGNVGLIYDDNGLDANKVSNHFKQLTATNIADNLTTADSNQALSANQGMALKQLIDVIGNKNQASTHIRQVNENGVYYVDEEGYINTKIDEDGLRYVGQIFFDIL